MDAKKFFENLKEVNYKDEDFTAMQGEDQLKVSGWKKGGKYIASVSDGEITIEDNARYKYLASYISDKDRVVAIKLQRFEKDKKGNLLPSAKEFTLGFKQANKMTDFLQFLKEANLGSLTSGKFKLVDNLSLDPDIYSKLVTLSTDEIGRENLIKLIKEGYLKLNLDLPELIKLGISKSELENNLKKLDNFETLISKSDVKEVSEIQAELRKIPWIFGPEYISLDFRAAGEEGNPDGRLKRFDGLSDILEVKLPSEILLRQDAKHPSRQFMSANLSRALGQLTGYLEFYDSEYSTERDDDGKEILEDRYGKYYKPRGILLIGRRDSAQPKRLRRLLAYFHRIEIITYDDLIDKARSGLRAMIKNNG